MSFFAATKKKVQQQSSRQQQQNWSTTNDDSTLLPPEVESVMMEIVREWDFMSTEEFNPVTMALELLDTNQATRSIDDFESVMSRLETAMDLIVNDHYQAFNGSIETFARVTTGMADSKRRSKQLRVDLLKCKELLLCRRPDLLQLYNKSVQYREMLRMLEAVEQLKQAPEAIGRATQQKQYQLAVRLLQNALKTLQSPDFADIGALADIRTGLNVIKSTLHETIIEDLHRVLYYANDNTPSNTNDKSTSTNSTNSSTSSSSSNITMMLMALEALGRIQDAAQVIKQRIPVELLKITSAITKELKEDWKSDLFILQNQSHTFSSSSTSKLSKLQNLTGAKFLEELVSRVYKRFDSILNMHQFAIKSFLKLQLEVSNVSNVSNDKNEKKFLRYNLLDLWNSIQQEIKNLMTSYLFDRSLQSVVPIDINQELIKTSNGVSNRQLFKFISSTSAVTSQIVDINCGLGVVDKMSNNTSSNSNSSEYELAIRPSIFNILRIIQPTLTFVVEIEKKYFGRLADYNNSSGLLFFVSNDLLIKSFIPQIEDLIIQKFYSSVNNIDSFRLEQFDGIQLPLLRSSFQLMEICRDLCLTGLQIPIRQEEFIRILEIMLLKYFEKCNNRFKDLQYPIASNDSNDDNERILSGNWIENEEIKQLLKQYLSAVKNNNKNDFDMLSRKETLLEYRLQNDRSIHRSELLFDTQKLEIISSLCTSLDWIVGQLRKVISTSNSVIIEKTHLLEFCLRLDQATKLRFDTILDKFDSLSKDCLFLLRVELRCHCLYFMDLAGGEGSYCLEQKASDPDAHISLMNQDLLLFEQLCDGSLSPIHSKFVMDGVGGLVSDGLLRAAGRIKRLNSHGVDKMLRNILAIQQNLNNISLLLSVDGFNRLDRVRGYYELYRMGARRMLDVVRENGPVYAYEEYALMLQFIHQEILSIDGNPKKKIYDQDLSELRSLLS